jgi:hypothetical protein
MTAVSYLAKGEPVATSSLIKSPVDKCLNLYFFTRTSHWLNKILITFLFLIQALREQRKFQQPLEDEHLLQLALL